MTYQVGRCLLRFRLQLAKMSQAELARRLGITKQQVSKYVNGDRQMSLKTAKNVASLLKCSIEDLYEWDKVGEDE